jgi:hypothetical protein
MPRGEVVTGLLYVDAPARDLHDPIIPSIRRSISSTRANCAPGRRRWNGSAALRRVLK